MRRIKIIFPKCWTLNIFLCIFLIFTQWEFCGGQNDVPPLEPAEKQQKFAQAIEPARAFAAPINRQLGNSVAINGEHKPFFKIHYRDGIQKAIFDETPRRVPPDFEDNNDIGIGGGREFDAYEDTKLVDPRNEVPLFIPFLYRNESSEEGEKQPQLNSSPAPPIRTARPLVAPDVLQSRQPIIVRTTTPGPFGRPIRPAQPFGRPPPPPPPSPQFPPPPQRPPPPPPQFPPQQQPFLPQQPIQPFQQRPSAGLPPPPPQQFRPQIPPRFPPTPPAPQSATPSPPFQPQIPQRPPQQPPPVPSQPQFPPPSRPSPQAPIGNLRSGVCHHSIFYMPQPVNAFDVQRIYTHFAMVVSVDQCARTCHEFNCDVAILDPRTRHCQFNPSTAFRLPPSCPQWPNPLFRNNFQLSDELIKIQCVTCQQKRRGHRPPGAQQLPASLPPSGPSQQQQSTSSLRRPSQPQFVLRTTTRERIGNADLNGNNLNASPIQRVANAAKTRSFASTNIENNNNNNNGEEDYEKENANNGGEEQRNLSEEFHKLERLLKSAEDYLDETGTGGHGRRHNARGREVPSWREGHPQGDGNSPLKINPLRRPQYFADNIRPSPIFYSTDSLNRKAEEDDLIRKRRTQRETQNAGEDGEEISTLGLAPSLNGKPKLNSAGSVKLQAQEPSGLRELELPMNDGKEAKN